MSFLTLYAVAYKIAQSAGKSKVGLVKSAECYIGVIYTLVIEHKLKQWAEWDTYDACSRENG